MNTNWADLNRDGRRLERIIKHMETKYKNNPSLELAYINTLIKLTHEKKEIVEVVMSVKALVKRIEKQLA